MDVGLVPGVEDDRIRGRIEDPMQGDRQLDHTEIRPEVAAGARDVLDEELADLGGELLELLDAQRVEIPGAGDGGQQRHRSPLLDRDTTRQV